MTELSKEQVIEVLKTVEDPELLMDIWFLGLIYSIEIEEALVKIEMTLTSPMCPVGPQMVDQVKSKVAAMPGVELVDVRLVFSPPWEPNDEVKAYLGLM